MKNIKIDRIYCLILISAMFNDIFRIPGTRISIFRFLIFVLVLIVFKARNYCKNYFYGICIIGLIDIIQNVFYINYFKQENQLDYKYMAIYVLYYLEIVLLFMLIKIIYKTKKDLFYYIFEKILPIVFVVKLFIYILMPYLSRIRILTLANRNNYALELAAICPIVLTRRKTSSYCLIFLTEIILFVYGSKTAFFGILIEVLIYLILIYSEVIRQKIIPIMAGIIIIVIFLFVLVVGRFEINGYLLLDIFQNYVIKILKGELYTNIVSYSSQSFRSDAIVSMIALIKNTYGFGVGLGNTSKYLYYVLPAAKASLNLTAVGVAPHCAYLEFMADNGIWAIILLVSVVIKNCKMLFFKKEKIQYDYCSIMIVFSAPIWIMSSSIVYSCFSMFIVFAWLAEYYLEQNNDDNKSRYKRRIRIKLK